MSLTTWLEPLLAPFRSPRPAPIEYEPTDLPFVLPLTTEVAEHILRTESLAPHLGYRRFTKTKKTGGQREILEPDTRLKEIQRQLIALYLNDEAPHSAATAYRHQRSIADHVWTHAGAEIIITADIRDFFPTTKSWRIERYWQTHTDDRLARLYTLLTTYRDSLPQGAPTSPALSNLVNVELDTRLGQLVEPSLGKYTRYCDDMVFSWPRAAVPPTNFENTVRAITQEFGYTLHPTKGWCTYERRDEPTITGAVLTKRGSVRVLDPIRRRIDRLSRSNNPDDIPVLMGLLGYEKMITRRPRR